jgi:dipeptidase
LYSNTTSKKTPVYSNYYSNQGYHQDKQTFNDDATFWAHRNMTRLGTSERDFAENLSRNSMTNIAQISLAQRMVELVGAPVSSEYMANPKYFYFA